MTRAISAGGTAAVLLGRHRRAVGRRVDRLGSDRVAADAVVAVLARDDLREGDAARPSRRSSPPRPRTGAAPRASETQTIAPPPAATRCGSAACVTGRRAQVERELGLEVLDRRAGDGLVGREAADEVDDRAQRRVRVAPRRDGARDGVGVGQVGWTTSAPCGSASRVSSATTRQPASANAATTAGPRPPVPPVISAVAPPHARRHRPIPRSTFRPMVVRELTDGQEVDDVLLVRERERASATAAYLRLTLGDRTGTVAAVAGRRRRPVRVCGCGVAVHVQGATRPPALRRADRDPPLRPPRASRLGALLDGPPRDAAQMEDDLRELVATVQNPHLRALLEAVLGPRRGDLARLPRRPRRQALPPGLPPRAARALADRRPVRLGDRGDVPGHRPRRRRHRRAAARHRQARGLHGATRWRSTSPTRGKLQGEIALGYYRVRRLIEDLPGFPRRARRRPCCTSSSATTARSSTARPSCRARARRRSCT